MHMIIEFNSNIFFLIGNSLISGAYAIYCLNAKLYKSTKKFLNMRRDLLCNPGFS